MKQIVAPMAAIIVEIKVKPGEIIEKGAEVVLLESMKMQIPVASEHSGKVVQIHGAAGDFVNEGQSVVTIE